jgi:hypothetical protein
VSRSRENVSLVEAMGGQEIRAENSNAARRGFPMFRLSMSLYRHTVNPQKLASLEG